ncbi:NADH-quinone oxidoreductase subunit F [Nocardia sp. ET3-3]|uniref:NADH-quinone oxidoreductase subunit F n=1 Tax=Nocardia terrae TaxID=2675851 RepID=A0A7K1V7S2_9NOCA|nr:NADH-ubiquinone oxidoreductase-F iron-sulfur binding region domain-containing protein [Nocardia terrae]MVU82512.1 NADH-quinone oxidoreductase subunit F [Nocardia terrae]
MNGLGSMRAPGVRLLAAPAAELTAHEATHGRLPVVTAALLDAVAASGLRGRGGAGFPTARKLGAVAAAARPIVIANGAEGEPDSHKDAVLLTRAPHLVLDGLVATAAAVGSRDCRLYAPEAVLSAVRRAIAERRAAGYREPKIELTAATETFLAGEKSAVVNRLAGRAAVPVDQVVSLSRSGLHGRPTLVQNVETLAQVGLIARYGPGWFRAVGVDTEPGTRLISLSGTRNAGVFEVASGIGLGELLSRWGGTDPATVRAVLVGGWHGSWISGLAVAGASLSGPGLEHLHAHPGAGVLRVLPHGQCGLRATAEIVDYLARQSAGQCGPCRNGLPTLAAGFAELVDGGGDPGEVARVARLVVGRGACHHPDGTARLVGSALTVFADDLARHRRGSCTAGIPLAPIGAAR